MFTAAAAEREAKKGNRLVLCRTETSPDDLKGMLYAQGILTTRGGVSSHAALVARQLGKVCVCGATDVVIDYEKRMLRAGGVVVNEGDFISLDGSTGEIYAGAIESADSEVKRVLSGALPASESYAYQLFETVMRWADGFRKLKVRTNADTPSMATQAVSYGAEGIGLCRTEHMFFEGNRIDAMREMILASDSPQRRAALAKLLPFQRDDFIGLFRAMSGRPVTIRLLDPPLHEFLPQDDDVRRQLASKLGVALEYVIERIRALHEENPMLGCRGCRLGILYPEITEMQVRAIFEAATQVAQEEGRAAVKPEIMIPLVGHVNELAATHEILEAEAKKVQQAAGTDVDYMFGTMIEVPRGALTADQIAKYAQFFSFGTNDLTQMTFGYSRDDAEGGFLLSYVERGILPANPFQTLDVQGVGQLVRIAVEKGRAARPDIKLGICGEHGGDPASIAFFNEVGLDYVSCSPYRVPVARLAAAQAALASAGERDQ